MLFFLNECEFYMSSVKGTVFAITVGAYLIGTVYGVAEMVSNV